MYICKFFKSKSLGRRLFFLLTALLLVASLVSIQAPEAAFAVPPDPPDGRDDQIQIHPPQFTPPENGFTWSVPPRYGVDSNHDSLVDTHWQASTFDYASEYIYPDTWPMRFFGCQTEADVELGSSTTNTYEWNIDGDIVNDGRCVFTYNGFPHQGTYDVTLTYTPQGGTPVSFPQQVYIRDYFLVAIGDSFASGEGNPDVRQQVVPTDPFGGWIPGNPAQWQDERCHRSAYSYSSQAAIDLEFSDPHTSVTFISFACSGATIFTPAYDLWDQARFTGTGILGPYRGLLSLTDSYDIRNFIPPQIEQVQAALNPPGGKDKRQFDALIITAGGNDFHFGDIAAACLIDGSCWPDAMLYETPGIQYNMQSLIERALTPYSDGGSPYSLPDAFAALQDHIVGNVSEGIPRLDPQPDHVYINQYADQTRTNNSGYCRMLDDMLWPLDFAVTPEEAMNLATNGLQGLNQAIQDAADLYNWRYVDGLSTYVNPVTGEITPGEFVVGPDGRGHGYCASDNWIIRADESEKIQGPGPFLRLLTRGTLHPNLKGIQIIKDRLLHYLRPDLEASLPGNPPGDPPIFTSSLSSGGLSSQPGANGWYTRSCDSSNNCSDQVVLQVAATGSAPLEGASVYLNDQAGCPISGVTCPTTVITPTNQLIWDFNFTTDGIYLMQFSARDSNDQMADYTSEIKVDLHDPVFNPLPGPFSVDEGSSITLTAQAGDTTSAILNYDWDLDNDGDFETKDEEPSFSAASLDGPESKTVGVLVTDEAGRFATATTTINVLNVAPTAAIIGAPATSMEGTAISLSSQVIDPGTGDTFTYDWVVKKDGVNYAAGANANFSFTPSDNGSYEVSLSVTDKDGGVGTASKTITVHNVDPSLSSVAVTPTALNEGEGATLTGSFSDPGSADTFELTVSWGDGSAATTIQLAAGSTSFSLNHTYGDDNPTGTASDTNNIAVSLNDDDGGTGTGSASVIVNNLAPSVFISVPDDGTLYGVNTEVNLSASLTDPSTQDALTCSVSWGDGATESGTLVAGVCNASHVYTSAGVYTIQVTGTDDDMGSKTESVMVVVYDPSAGFVTGGGWIESPAGAYVPDESLSGKATFGFVSKYQKGSNTPSGNTAFKFDLAGLAFTSQSYDWLVVNQAGSNAQFKGSGLINGATDANGNAYKFMLWATDSSPDTFHIRIWWEDAASEHDVYNNGVDQAIGAGSIVVHTSK